MLGLLPAPLYLRNPRHYINILRPALRAKYALLDDVGPCVVYVLFRPPLSVPQEKARLRASFFNSVAMFFYTIMRWYSIVGFNVPLDTLWVISETILRVTWPNQQCHSTERQKLADTLFCSLCTEYFFSHSLLYLRLMFTFPYISDCCKSYHC